VVTAPGWDIIGLGHRTAGVMGTTEGEIDVGMNPDRVNAIHRAALHCRSRRPDCAAAVSVDLARSSDRGSAGSSRVVGTAWLTQRFTELERST
jgi:hypothetical protein